MQRFFLSMVLTVSLLIITLPTTLPENSNIYSTMGHGIGA